VEHVVTFNKYPTRYIHNQINPTENDTNTPRKVISHNWQCALLANKQVRAFMDFGEILLQVTMRSTRE
jgi:hypothetical protein